MNLDYVLNGVGHGEVGDKLHHAGYDTGILRPFVGADGRSYVTINRGGKPTVLVTNAPATLRKDEWIHMDRQLLLAARQRLKLVNSLRTAGLSYAIPNGMGKTVLQTENVSDSTGAEVSMDGLRSSLNDRPHIDITNLPLPIVHRDFSFSARQIETSRNMGTPLDTTMGEQAARAVAEKIEQMAIGESAIFKNGGASIYGVRNFPNRITKVLATPTGSNPTATVQDVLDMRQSSYANRFYGPWALYTSLAWDEYLDQDYTVSTSTNMTLRERLLKINGITKVETLDYLPGNDMILVQETTDVIRMVIGMDLTVLQWDSMGGLLKNFKVMAIMVPQIRADQNSRTGLVHGATA